MAAITIYSLHQWNKLDLPNQDTGITKIRLIGPCDAVAVALLQHLRSNEHSVCEMELSLTRELGVSGVDPLLEIFRHVRLERVKIELSKEDPPRCAGRTFPMRLIQAMGESNSSIHIKCLEIRQDVLSYELASAIKDLLEVNTSLEELSFLETKRQLVMPRSLIKELAAQVAAGLWYNCTLHTLKMNYLPLEDDDIELLVYALDRQSRTRLRHLELASTKIGSEGASLLAAALEENTILQTLDLRRCDNIGEGGIRDLIDSLPHMRGLRKLMMSRRLHDGGENIMETLLLKGAAHNPSCDICIY